MIPGIQTKISESTVASAAIINVLSDLITVTGAVTIQTILSPLQGSSMVLFMRSTDAGGLVLGAAGNILVGDTIPINRLAILVWSKAAGKWIISSD